MHPLKLIYLLFFCFSFLMCKESEQNNPFAKIQQEQMRKVFPDKSNFNLKGKVNFLVFADEIFNQEEAENSIWLPAPVHDKKGIHCDLISDVIARYSLNDFEYYEYDLSGNVTKVIQGPCSNSQMKEYEYSNKLLTKIKDFRNNSQLDDITIIDYNESSLWSQIVDLKLIDSTWVENYKTEYSYTENFMKINRFSNLIGEVEGAWTNKFDKQYNYIDGYKNIKYTFNEDSLVTERYHLSSKEKDTYFYDAFGMKVRESSYDSLGKLIRGKYFYYDSQSQLVETITQDSTNIRIERLNDRYKLKDYFSGNYHTEWENYNEYGDMIQSSRIEKIEDGSLKEIRKTYKYEYDKNKNWVKMKSFVNDTLSGETTRIIEYYE